VFVLRDSLDPVAEDGGRVEVAFTDARLDLQEGGDGLAEGLATLETATGTRFARLHQVHGDRVVVVDDEPERGGPGGTGGPGGEVAEGDALVTTRRRTGLMVRVADCVPVVLADPETGVVGAVHAGRRGVEADVVTRAVERMRDLGARDVQAWIGPHICGRCYEVPEAMRAAVAAAVPAAYAQTSWGTPALDLGAGVEDQLAAAGVAAIRVAGCTFEDDRLHSFRRDGAASGRFAGLVWIG